MNNNKYQPIDTTYILNAEYEYDTYGAIYARYSSSSQTEQSIEGQLRDNFEYAKRERIKIIDVYIDRAISGKTDDRPQFQQMIKDSAKRQWRYVIVWKLDRFARNRYDSAMYKYKLKTNGVRVLSSQENIGDSPESVILESVLEGCAEYFSLDLQKKILRGNKESYLKGQACGGTPPFGYKIVNKKYMLDEEKAPIMQYIFKEYANGRSKKDIFAELTAIGITNSKGKPLDINSFHSCFSNRRYIGEVIHHGELYTNIFPPLIDAETFEKVQLKLKQKKHAPASEKAIVDYALRGKVFCGHCGVSMVGECGTGKSGERYFYYTCYNRKKHKSCNKKLEKKDFVERYAVDLAIEYFLNPIRTEYIAQRVVDVYNNEFNDDEVGKLEKQLMLIEDKIKKNVNKFVDTENAAIRRQIEEIVDDLEIQRNELSIDLHKLRTANSIRLTKDQIIIWLKSFQHGSSDDPVYCRRVIDSLINSVYVSDDKYIIYFNVKDGKTVSFIDATEDLEIIEENETKSQKRCSDLTTSAVKQKTACTAGQTENRMDNRKNPKTVDSDSVRIYQPLVNDKGFEPLTFASVAQRSIQLS